MREVDLFTDALRAVVPMQPSCELTATVVPRLAAAARSSTIEAEPRSTRSRATSSAGRSRRALVAKIAFAVALVPLLLAGLAFAGVTVPAPARNAFDSVGIVLPNQPADHGGELGNDQKESPAATGQGGGNQVSGAAHAEPKGEQGNSSAAHEHARKQHEKAQGEAKGHENGNAVGLNG
jgi:hypothetical protein